MSCGEYSLSLRREDGHEWSSVGEMTEDFVSNLSMLGAVIAFDKMYGVKSYDRSVIAKVKVLKYGPREAEVKDRLRDAGFILSGFCPSLSPD